MRELVPLAGDNVTGGIHLRGFGGQANPQRTVQAYAWAIQDLGGRISLKSERGRGMTIQLALPLTLAVMDGMVIKVGRETYVTPMSSIVPTSQLQWWKPAASDLAKARR